MPTFDPNKGQNTCCTKFARPRTSDVAIDLRSPSLPQQRDSTYSATRVRIKEMRGGIGALGTLQENRLLLLGSENGQIVLMA